MITRICVLLTGCLLLLMGFGVYTVGLPNELNEIGDAVAGFAGALAFIWLVGGYFIQNKELAETRKEYEGMRVNIEKQSQYMRRDDCFKIAKTYMSALDGSVDSFEAVFAVANKACLKLDETLIARMHAYGILRDIVIEKSADEQFRRRFAVYVAPLNQEISRYHSIYLGLEKFLSQVEDGKFVREVLLRGSIYERVEEVILEASSNKDLVRKVFSSKLIAPESD